MSETPEAIGREACLASLTHERGTRGQAWFSADREYRHLLLRGGEIDAVTPVVVFIMLNPSTADADQDDPTIRKCIKFAAKFTAGEPHRVAIVNLYAVRATDPDVAFRHPRPVGHSNDDVILALALRAKLVIAAWGADPRSMSRALEVRRLLYGRAVLHRIGPPSKNGSPRHPLYLRDASELEQHE